MLGDLRAALALPSSPLIPPWSKVLDKSHPSLRLRRHAVALLERHSSRFPRVLAAAAWPLTSTLRIARHMSNSGLALAKGEGIGIIRQLGRQIALANLCNLPPADFYGKALYRASRPERFIHDLELQALLRELYAGLDWNALDHKYHFFQHCRKHGLPTPEVLASVADGEIDWCSDAASIPQETSIVFKPDNASGGSGFERWDWVMEDQWARYGTRLNAVALLERAQMLSASSPLLVQVCLETHADISGFGPCGLPTMRIVTYRPVEGPAALLTAELRMPVGDLQVDNVGAGGITSAIDIDTGILKGHAQGGRYNGSVDAHPDSGDPIRGVPIPDWEAVVESVCEGHRTFSEYAFVGWDVACTPEGPSLVEGNTLWGIPVGCCLGETPFVECYLEHARAKGIRVAK